MNAAAYSEAESVITDLTPRWPPAMLSASNLRGGIIGTAEIVDCVEHSDSPWFFGPFGLVLENVKPTSFIPVKGALGLFDWRKKLENTK